MGHIRALVNDLKIKIIDKFYIKKLFFIVLIS